MASIQALSRGEATPEQQKRALDWIINKAAMTYDEPFVPGQSDVTSYLSGRMSVGRQIIKLIKINISQVFGGPPREQG